MDVNDLSNELMNSLDKFHTDVQKISLRVQQLEEENDALREQLQHGTNASPFAISDEELKSRVARLGNAPLDTIIREAGVTLENRLRFYGGETCALEHGTKLVDKALTPSTGVIVFSDHGGEQDGVRFLYRGAMQFIRNPPMHRLVEYQESTARLLIKLIDSLLLLLEEGRAPMSASDEDGLQRWNGEKPVKQVVWEAVQSITASKKKKIFAPKQIYQEITKIYPNFNQNTVNCQLIADCVNHNSRHHYPGGNDYYWWVQRGKYRLFEPGTDKIEN